MFSIGRRFVPGVQHRRRHLGVTVALVALVGVLGGTGNAMAAPGSAATDTPGSTDNCTTECYDWYISGGTGLGGYAKVEWTSNPDDYLIQVRVWCSDTLVSYWSPSGVVKKVDLWDQAGCNADGAYYRGGSYVHFSYDGGSSWTKYCAIPATVACLNS
jgi:hypothetical protein